MGSLAWALSTSSVDLHDNALKGLHQPILRTAVGWKSGPLEEKSYYVPVPRKPREELTFGLCDSDDLVTLLKGVVHETWTGSDRLSLGIQKSCDYLNREQTSKAKRLLPEIHSLLLEAGM